MPRGTLLLNRQDIASLLSLSDYVEIVENAFRLHAEGKTLQPGLLHIDAPTGEFHIKGGGLRLERTYCGVKVNAGFFQNRERFGMPNVQGTIVLCDGENGYPLALMDSIEITLSRTGATTAVAAKYLARPDSRIATICGCGVQGRIQLRAIKLVLPIEKVFAFDNDPAAAEAFASEMGDELDIEITAVAEPAAAVASGDVCITCTPAKQHFVERAHVHVGAFIAAVGADSPGKHEIEPGLMASATVVVDLLEQCARVGELHHALEAGLLTVDDVHADLGEIVSGRKPGRTSDDEIIIFDATGTALQDAAGAAAAYERALEAGIGTFFDFAASSPD
ncbi:MAG: ornithine cyclodeaminase family protein [Gemmatimonadales bacterium]|jgi:ornithine cyclodeaminase/alanine dehydrogenase